MTATYYYERASDIDSAGSQTVISISSAELSGAGFAAGDDVLVLVYCREAGSALNINVTFDLQEAGVSQFATPALYRTAAGNRYRAYSWMERMTLDNPLATITLVVNTSGGNTRVKDASIFILKLSDLGVEDTDWYWDTAGANTNTTTMADRASTTWTPAVGGQDWVCFAANWTQFENTAVQAECQLLLDGVLQGTMFSMQARDAAEEAPCAWWAYFPSVSAAAHTVKIQTRDSGSTGTRSISRESATLVFKASKFQTFASEVGDQSITPADADQQLTTLTDALSGTTDLFIWGQGAYDQANFVAGYLWVKSGGSAIEPIADAGSDSSWFINNAADQMMVPWMGVLTSQSGSMDLDLFARYATNTGSVLDPGLLVLGLTPTGGGGGGGAKSQATFVG